MNDLRNLYQEVIIDHSHHPRNFKVCETANYTAEGYNPLCGDRITLYITVKDGVIEDVCFQGEGCAIFMASSSMMTGIIKGMKVAEIKDLYQAFHTLVTSGDTTKLKENMGKLAVFSGVAEFPIRVKCATLPWHALKEALSKEKECISESLISTEVSAEIMIIEQEEPVQADILSSLESDVWEKLKLCYDPEIPVNIVDLGLIYGVAVIQCEEGNYIANIRMTLTTPGCAMVNFIIDEVKGRVATIPKITEVNVELTFDPPWDRSMISMQAKLALGIL